MDFDIPVIKELIRARIIRTIIYLQKYVKELPKYQLQLRHKFQHPILNLEILAKQLSCPLKLSKPSSYPLPEGGIPEDINYFELALNELKTAYQYFKLRPREELFRELEDYYLEQKLLKIIGDLKALQEELF
ncbi:MAG: hypothetical protein ACTSRS_13675 [Candidatus Helarchaeota archaeon]